MLGQLLLSGIPAHKSYTRYPGFDLTALNPATGKSCKIQVKSRWATDYDRTFPLKRGSDCDFVVFAELNRGFRGYGKNGSSGGVAVKAPRFFVFPFKIVDSVIYVAGSWSKVKLASVPNADIYLDRWDLIRKFLRLPAVAAPEES